MDDLSRPNTHQEVQRYYGETLGSSDDLKTTACCTASAPPVHIKDALALIHPEVSSRYYGCGLVLPEAIEGLRVLDLGCGAGRDVYVLSKLVGQTGQVVGVDMTAKQLDVARQHQDWHAEAFGYEESNVEFIQANIEELDQTGLADGSFDLIVSNCVINLAVDKGAVLRSAHRLLDHGGEMYFSDVYADRRIPSVLASDPVLYGECLAGALYWGDFVRLARTSGFADVRLVEDDPVDMTDPEIAARVGDIRFRAATCRLFRLEGLESTQEDYGQQATYLGTLESRPNQFDLDVANSFLTGEKQPVSANTAEILSKSRFSGHFTIFNDNSMHMGIFNRSDEPGLFTKTPDQGKGGDCC